MAALPKPSSQKFPVSQATPFGVSLGDAGEPLGAVGFSTAAVVRVFSFVEGDGLG